MYGCSTVGYELLPSPTGILFIAMYIGFSGLQEKDQGAAHALNDTIQSQSLYESPAFSISREGLEELVAEVKRVDALITNKPPGHPVGHSAFAAFTLIQPPVCDCHMKGRLLRFHDAGSTQCSA